MMTNNFRMLSYEGHANEYEIVMYAPLPLCLVSILEHPTRFAFHVHLQVFSGLSGYTLQMLRYGMKISSAYYYA